MEPGGRKMNLRLTTLFLVPAAMLLLAACAEAGGPAGPINDLDTVFADPQVRARELKIAPDGVPGIRSPFRFSDADLALDEPSPRPGDLNPK